MVHGSTNNCDNILEYYEKPLFSWNFFFLHFIPFYVYPCPKSDYFPKENRKELSQDRVNFLAVAGRNKSLRAFTSLSHGIDIIFG